MNTPNKIFFTTLFLCFFAVGNIASGNDISILQQFLINNGFLKIPAPTGYFGPLTEAALSAWQVKAGMHTSTNAVNADKGNGSPTRLTISKLNIDAGFQYTGLKSDGAMEVPNNIFDVGWFTGSARPGEKGVAVITGHVAQIRGGVVTKQGVFYNLNELRAGDKISVLNDKGASMTFVVREIRTYDPQADATDVFTSKDNLAHLNLITCEGAWNPTKASYNQRLVIFTDLAP